MSLRSKAPALQFATTFHVKHRHMAALRISRRPIRSMPDRALWGRVAVTLTNSFGMFHVKRRTYVLFHVKLEADSITPAT